MKANFTARTAKTPLRRHIPRPLRGARLLAAGMGASAVLLALGSCSERSTPVVSVAAPLPPPPVVTPPPAQRPFGPRPQPAAWQDAPLTPGAWRYSNRVAHFGGDVVLACASGAGGRSVALSLLSAPGMGPIAAGTPVTLVTSTSQRQLAFAAEGTVSLAANDPLLDAIAFARGRFVVEVAGLAPLILPSRPEVSRVVEDCRGG